MPRSHKTAGARGGGGVLPGRGPLAPGLAKRPRRGGAKPRPSGVSALCAPAAPRAPAVFSQAVAAARATMAQEAAPPKGARPPQAVKKWLAPLFQGVHSPLRLRRGRGGCAEKPLLRKAFCGFAVHAAKSDYSLRGLRPPNPRGFFDRRRRPRPPKGRGLL